MRLGYVEKTVHRVYRRTRYNDLCTSWVSGCRDDFFQVTFSSLKSLAYVTMFWCARKSLTVSTVVNFSPSSGAAGHTSLRVSCIIPPRFVLPVHRSFNCRPVFIRGVNYLCMCHQRRGAYCDVLVFILLCSSSCHVHSAGMLRVTSGVCAVSGCSPCGVRWLSVRWKTTDG